jgi:hypothetical protein
MSFLTGTQMECLYSMPANATAVTAAAQTQLTGTPVASNPSYQLPAYFFPNGQGGPGKSLIIKAGGFFTIGTTAVTDVIQLAFDSSINTFGIAVAKTGAFTTTASVTNGAWFMDLNITCQQVGTTTNLISTGTLDWGTGNNAATAANVGYMVGSPNAAVVINNATPYFLEMWNTWNVTTGAPTITCNQFMVFGCN